VFFEETRHHPAEDEDPAPLPSVLVLVDHLLQVLTLASSYAFGLTTRRVCFVKAAEGREHIAQVLAATLFAHVPAALRVHVSAWFGVDGWLPE
jgi:hypothetical protein